MPTVYRSTRGRWRFASQQMQILQEALDELSEKEQDILRVTFLWHQPGQEHQRVPPKALAELAARYDTTAPAIRQARKRALDKIRAYVDDRYQPRDE